MTFIFFISSKAVENDFSARIKIHSATPLFNNKIYGLGSAMKRSSGYCIMVSWIFMACSAVYYIGSNSSLVPFFGTLSGLVMMLICGVFDMSAALFLLFKLAWQNYERFKL